VGSDAFRPERVRLERTARVGIGDESQVRSQLGQPAQVRLGQGQAGQYCLRLGERQDGAGVEPGLGPRELRSRGAVERELEEWRGPSQAVVLVRVCGIQPPARSGDSYIREAAFLRHVLVWVL